MRWSAAKDNSVIIEKERKNKERYHVTQEENKVVYRILGLKLHSSVKKKIQNVWNVPFPK